jgi:hypothetical protein
MRMADKLQKDPITSAARRNDAQGAQVTYPECLLHWEAYQLLSGGNRQKRTSARPLRAAAMLLVERSGLLRCAGKQATLQCL